MKEIKILLLTDREPEDSLIRTISRCYGISDGYCIWSCNIQLFELYDWLISAGGDNFEKLKFMDVLRMMEKRKEYKLLCNQRFSHIVLSYDFITLDYKYNMNKIQRLFNYFDKTKGNGKLYLNYPSMEAFYHSEEWKEGEFAEKILSAAECTIFNYRRKLGRELGITHMNLYTKEELHKVLMVNLRKAYAVQGRKYWPDMEQEEYRYINFSHILQKQVERYHAKGEMPVLCTSIFLALEMVGVEKKELLKVFKD